tara:strand:+ start:242 stop:952 length:711 start_codon:yes stop_codon:yes gene_type:complete
MSTDPEKKEETVKKTVKKTVKETTSEEKREANHFDDDSIQQLGTPGQQTRGWSSFKGGKRTRKRKRKRKRKRTISKTRKKKGGLTEDGDMKVAEIMNNAFLESENSPEVMGFRQDAVDQLLEIDRMGWREDEKGLELSKLPLLSKLPRPKTRKHIRRKGYYHKMNGGHHLYKRLGVSKYATKKTIKNAYNKLKKGNKLTSKVKRAYKILSKNKTRKQYNNKYKKHKKLKRRKRKRV